jgi:hypothetical protein
MVASTEAVIARCMLRPAPIQETLSTSLTLPM